MRKNLKTLLSAAVASAMMLTSVSVTSYAATSVSTLEALQAAITSGETDITVTAPLTITSDVTLSSTTGVTITTTGVEDAFNVTGSLTLGDGITINSADESVLWANGGTITVNGAEITSGSNTHNLAFVGNGGTINVKSGTVTGTGAKATFSVSGAGSTINVSGTGTVVSEQNTAITVKNNATGNISGGTVKTNATTDNWTAVTVQSGGSAEVSGSAVITAEKGAALTVENTGSATVEGGELTGGTTAFFAWDGASATIEDGTFTATIDGQPAVNAQNSDNIEVSGGTFSSDLPDDYLADDVEQDASGNVVGNVINTEAELLAAIANGGEVVIGGDITLTAPITISNTVTLKSDSDVTITTTGVEDAFNVTGSLTLGDGITINSADESVLWANGGTITVNGAEIVSGSSTHNLAFVGNGGTINVKSGTVTGTGAKATFSVSGAGSTINVSGTGTVVSEQNTAITVKNNATGNISGGVVKTNATSDNWTAVTVQSGGSVTVSGTAVIEAAKGAALTVENTGSATVEGGELTGGTTALFAWNGATAAVEDGTFTATIDGQPAVNAQNSDNIKVSGGSFSSDLPDEYIVPTDKTLVKNETTGLWELGVKAVTAIAITTPPTKTEYEVGDTLDTTGLVITATYNDETTAEIPVADVTVTGFDSTTAGEKTITVTYEGKTATFTVTVEEAADEEPDEDEIPDGYTAHTFAAPSWDPTSNSPEATFATIPVADLEATDTITVSVVPISPSTAGTDWAIAMQAGIDPSWPYITDNSATAFEGTVQELMDKAGVDTVAELNSVNLQLWHTAIGDKIAYKYTITKATTSEPEVTTTTTTGNPVTPDDTPSDESTTTTQAPTTNPGVITSYVSSRPAGSGSNSGAVTTTTTTTTTTTPAEEDEEIEDDIEIEEDDDVEIEEDTDTTQPAEDDYEDDDTDEEVDADVETPADGSSDGNPITGVAISFAGVIASAAAIMLAKKRK